MIIDNARLSVFDLYHRVLMIDIPGKPQHQGSKRLVHRGRIMIDDNPNLLSWRGDAIAIMQAAYDGEPLLGPVECWAEFCFARPRSHYGTGRNANVLKPSAPIFHTSKPDSDKLHRALGDALTQAGVVIDDRVISEWRTRKLYDTRPHTKVIIMTPKEIDHDMDRSSDCR